MIGHKNPAQIAVRIQVVHMTLGIGLPRWAQVAMVIGTVALIVAAPVARAETTAAEPKPIASPTVTRGSVTNRPLPRFVSMKAAKANVRRGPGLTHRIDWVYKHRNMPLEITAEFGHWRRVRDMDGVGGWVHYSLLSGVRHAVVLPEFLTLRSAPSPKAQPVVQLAQGVIPRVGECHLEWCRLSIDGYKGWASKTDIWGVGPDELRD